ncbi:MAG TPA: DinB family protein [Candidatus Limnocylindrales bacterium]|nr:DinB family protein [Candidatus Limnocylindrales bacterium]
MKTLNALFLVLCLAPICLFAQNASAPKSQPQQAPSFSGIVERKISNLEKEFVEAAEAMPDDKFNFTPDSLGLKGSEYKGVKTFAEEVRHVAATNFALWGAVAGEKPPMDLGGDNGPESLKTKAEIVKFLKDSFALGHRAAKSLTNDNVLGTVQSPFGPQQVPRIHLATFAVEHAFDHYGQMVEYLRMNGIIPPASRPQPQK